MPNNYRFGRFFAETPLNLTDAERAKLIAYAREAIDRASDQTGPRINRLKRLIARLDTTEKSRKRTR